MFLRQYTRKKSGKVHRSWALVESLRTEEGPRQRVVAHLGELNHSQQRRWQRTVVFYNRHGDAEQLRLLKLDEIVARHLPAGRHTVRPADVVAIEGRFGKSRRVWVMDRGMMSEENLEFLSQPGRHYLIGTRRSELLIRPMWHQYDGRVEAHVMVCVLAYALWKTLDHLAKQAGLLTLIHKPDLARRQATAKPRPMSPEVILRELAKIQIGDIVLDASDGRQLVLRRVARPMPAQARILAALKLNLPERLSPDRLL